MSAESRRSSSPTELRHREGSNRGFMSGCTWGPGIGTKGAFATFRAQTNKRSLNQHPQPRKPTNSDGGCEGGVA